MPGARDAGVTTKAAGTAPRRGRPPRATPEQIVDAAVALVVAEPDEPLTMARVANAVGLTPMALYRHFKDRDELMDAVVGRILLERNAAIPREGPWQDQLRAWVLGGLDYLVPCAQVVQVVLRGWIVALVARRRDAGAHPRAGRVRRRRPRRDAGVDRALGRRLRDGGGVAPEGPEHVGDLRRARAPRRPTTPIAWRV